MKPKRYRVEAEAHYLFEAWKVERVEALGEGGPLERLDSDPAHA